MINPIEITKAWIKVFKGDVTPEYVRKAKICKGCNYSKHTTFLDFINDDLEEVKGLICTKCSCPLVAKIRSNDKCQKNKW